MYAYQGLPISKHSLSFLLALSAFNLIAHSVYLLLVIVFLPDRIIFVSNPSDYFMYISFIEEARKTMPPQWPEYSGTPLTSIGASPGYHLKIAEYLPDSGYFNFDGALDEVCIYDKALTSDEIQALYEEYIPPDIVYVDDDYNPSTPGWGLTHFNKIQDGIDAVNENGTVNVYSGIYDEYNPNPHEALVVIDKSLKLDCYLNYRIELLISYTGQVSLIKKEAF